MSVSTEVQREAPEYNVTGQDYSDESHFRYLGPPLIDIHAHVMQTRPDDPPTGQPPENGKGATTDQAALHARGRPRPGYHSNLHHVSAGGYSASAGTLRRFPVLQWPHWQKTLDEPDDAAYRLLDQFLAQGVKIIKFWAPPRGRERGLFVDAPWRIEAAKRAIAAGVRVFMVHVADPDVWFQTVYADAAKYGTKADQYVGLERLLQMFPEAAWIGAHMGGDPEHPEHLEALMEKYPHYHVDTSATKWRWCAR